MEGSTTYRDAPARCPACGVTMKERELFDSVVDECADCHGVWVDWFDVELERVVEQMTENAPRGAAWSKAEGTHGCPRCQSRLHEEERGPGGVLYRCGECGGAFVPRTSFDALVSGARTASPSSPPPASTSLPARLLAVLDWLLKGKD